MAFLDKQITEDFQYDLSLNNNTTGFTVTDISYDISVNDIPFVVSPSRDNPYTRETAPYRRDQVDTSPEPGEQSLVGWWLRSQTSWHNGAGITYYDPGTDFEHVSHRFYDSRGVDIWTIGEASLLKDTAEIFTSVYTTEAAVGNDETNDVLVLSNSNGEIKKLTPSADAVVTPVNIYGSLKTGHTSANPFLSVTTDGSHYYASCNVAIHVGNLNGSGADTTPIRHASATANVNMKYLGSNVYFGSGPDLYVMTRSDLAGDINHNSGTTTMPTNTTKHIDDNWYWSSFTLGNQGVYASGYSRSIGEIWFIPFDATTLLPNATKAYCVSQFPKGEKINAIEFYLGYLAIGTNKGLRIGQVNPGDGSLVYGPLLWDEGYAVNGLATKDSYVYAATTATSYVTGVTSNAILKKVDLGNPLGNGEFAYANDLEYQSTYNSEAKEVHNVNDRLIIVNSGNSTYEVQIEKVSNQRTTGWLQTGKIRYGTSEPKFFKYLNIRGSVTGNDSILLETVSEDNKFYSISVFNSTIINETIGLQYPTTSQEFISLKFTLNNASPLNTFPKLESYQLKAIPASRRQKLITYPLSCYDMEMDKYNVNFGYRGRANEVISTLEELEANGNFVNLQDFRTGEKYTGIIEKVEFNNVVPPDRDSPNYGGKLTITVRKL